MCVIEKTGKYELIICDKDHFPIVTFDTSSISQVCRILEEADLSRCDCKVIRKDDLKEFDTHLILEIWRNK